MLRGICVECTHMAEAETVEELNNMFIPHKKATGHGAIHWHDIGDEHKHQITD